MEKIEDLSREELEDRCRRAEVQLSALRSAMVGIGSVVAMCESVIDGKDGSALIVVE